MRPLFKAQVNVKAQEGRLGGVCVEGGVLDSSTAIEQPLKYLNYCIRVSVLDLLEKRIFPEGKCYSDLPV